MDLKTRKYICIISSWSTRSALKSYLLSYLKNVTLWRHQRSHLTFHRKLPPLFFGWLFRTQWFVSRILSLFHSLLVSAIDMSSKWWEWEVATGTNSMCRGVESSTIKGASLTLNSFLLVLTICSWDCYFNSCQRTKKTEKLDLFTWPKEYLAWTHMFQLLKLLSSLPFFSRRDRASRERPLKSPICN